jgi:hypothetical protein
VFLLSSRFERNDVDATLEKNFPSRTPKNLLLQKLWGPASYIYFNQSIKQKLCGHKAS